MAERAYPLRRQRMQGRHLQEIFDSEVARAKEIVLDRYPNSPMVQMEYLLDTFGPRHKNVQRAKLISDKTQENRSLVLTKALRDLNKLGFRIRNIYNISSRHIHALFAHYEQERAAKNMKISDFPSMHSIFGAFMQWIGKPNELKPLKEYLVDPKKSERSYIRTEDISWAALGVDPEQKIEEMKQHDVVCAMALQLIYAFGLRAKEALCIQPHQIESLDGKYIEIQKGTKGDRAREIPIETEYQRQTLELAKSFCKRRSDHIFSNDPRLKPHQKAKTLEQNERRLYYICELVGIKKGKNEGDDSSQVGVTLHGLRHQYAIKLYQEKTGELPPVAGGSIEAYYSEQYRSVREDISSRLGHARIGITSAYLGGRVKPTKPATKPTPAE